MIAYPVTPLVRLGNLFSRNQVYAKCEYVLPGGSFKIRGARHLLRLLSGENRTRQLVVPSMGNTALGAAVGAQAFGFTMTGVVPQSITPEKDRKLRALGATLVKIAGGGSDVLRHAVQVAEEQGGYFLHPHLDARWTDGYQEIGAEIQEQLPGTRTLVFPLGGGGLLMGLTEYFRKREPRPALHGCEPYNYPTYAPFNHQRQSTIADGLLLEEPHPQVQQRIVEDQVAVHLVEENLISTALAGLFTEQALVIEPSSAVPLAFVATQLGRLPEPIVIVLTGCNIGQEGFFQLIGS